MTVSGIDFICAGRDTLEIPGEVLRTGGFNFPEIHNSCEEMARLARKIKQHSKNTICMLPFCLTVESEALGAHVNLGNEKAGPRISTFSNNSIEELKEIGMMDFASGRIKEVLDAVEALSQSGEIVALNVGGPFTVITSLVDPMIFYKAIKKNREDVKYVLKIRADI
ncbi:MAG: uroporphyrinogen decarboxylase family protein [Syntrophomonas sp.]|jgi:uroporphyrinogen-III decarboxylase|uniref:uroporphyrinogen decarboxylase family protein n=1 Tax=Syntrophomonas sp. TaxID=2053627 RepID=UPI002603ED14|nr:uroporphyrinogen decarboxylase family protein [Syntrophomonas sp.]MDD2510403.1 uroporphyrinogen decarboxylase family protein [Syntrophomonas sp.]MDD3879127.1 uroporphyrinogen decarboxylase family protein [Syntrophomonas sp.]MDD4625573.1 uroporphyrinogen decarboxylase family protein [Syntrophomonas sp.]